MNKPNFIIAGEAKAGTTALYAYLSQHPEVFMCEPKEPRYFAFRNRRPDFRGPMDEDWFNRTTVYQSDEYYRLFADAEGKSAIGEASPIYMHVPGCAEAIAEELPNVKLIIILRTPIELAFSAYQHMVRNGKEPLSFGDALDVESVRIQQNWAWHWRYAHLGIVSENLANFFRCFPRNQLMIIHYDDFQKDNHAILSRVCDYLGIDAGYEFKYTKPNANSRPRLIWLHNIIMRRNHWLKLILRRFIPHNIRRAISLNLAEVNLRNVKEMISADERRKLEEFYAADVDACRHLLEMNGVQRLLPNKSD